MAEPFLGEIKINAFSFAPKNWALCDGRSLPVAQNQALYSLIGNAFGGNQQNFLLPNLQGCTAIHVNAGGGFPLGASGGEANHALSIGETPSHTHTVNAASASANAQDPTNAVLASAANVYAPAGNLTAIESSTISTVGGQPHNNMQPYLGLTFAIALTGIFPSRN